MCYVYETFASSSVGFASLYLFIIVFKIVFVFIFQIQFSALIFHFFNSVNYFCCFLYLFSILFLWISRYSLTISSLTCFAQFSIVFSICTFFCFLLDPLLFLGPLLSFFQLSFTFFCVYARIACKLCQFAPFWFSYVRYVDVIEQRSKNWSLWASCCCCYVYGFCFFDLDFTRPVLLI